MQELRQAFVSNAAGSWTLTERCVQNAERRRGRNKEQIGSFTEATESARIAEQKESLVPREPVRNAERSLKTQMKGTEKRTGKNAGSNLMPITESITTKEKRRAFA